MPSLSLSEYIDYTQTFAANAEDLDGAPPRVELLSTGQRFVPSDTDDTGDLYVHDLTTGQYFLVSAAVDGGPVPDETTAGFSGFDSLSQLSDGRALFAAVIGQTREYYVKDLTTGALTHIDADIPADFHVLTLSADGRYVAGTQPVDFGEWELGYRPVHTYRLDLTTGERIAIGSYQTFGPTFLTLSDDGSRLLVGEGLSARLVDVDTRAVVVGQFGYGFEGYGSSYYTAQATNVRFDADDGGILFDSQVQNLLPSHTFGGPYIYDLHPERRLYFTASTSGASLSFDPGDGSAALSFTPINGSAVVSRAYDIDGDYAGRLTATATGEAPATTALNIHIRAQASAGVSVAGGEGADLFLLSAYNDFAAGGGGNDNLRGGAGDDTLYGDAGDDILDGGAGADIMTGGQGDDRYIVREASDSVVEAADQGTDTIVSLISLTLGANIERLELGGADAINGTGNALNNVIVGNVARNTLNGGAGDDYLISYANLYPYAGDTLIGGTGDDTFEVHDLATAVVENAGEGTDTVRTDLRTYTLGANVENLFLLGLALDGNGNDGANQITGNDRGNQLGGGKGDDVLSGGAGNDTLLGGSGADRLIGGLGDDTYYIDKDDYIREAVDGGVDTVVSAISFTLGATLENLTLYQHATVDGTGNAANNVILGNDAANHLYGLGGDDTLMGDAGADILEGGAGDDILDGGAASDTLLGGDGADRLTGGLGTDTLSGGAGDDTYVISDLADVIVEASGGGIDTVLTTVSYTLTDINLENATSAGLNLSLTGNNANNVLTGNGSDDTLIGGKGDDRLYGGDGNDILNGGTGADRMVGGAGNDTYYVGAGDFISEAVDGGVDTVVTSYSFQLGATLENLTLITTVALDGTGNASANVITGNDAVNYLRGLGGADTLNGAGGNDVLEGGAGADILNGGAGADRFVYRAASEGGDTIQAFEHGIDRMIFSAAGFGSMATAGPVGGGDFVSGAGVVATEAHGQFLYDTSTGVLSWDADGTGSGAAVLIAGFAGRPEITASDLAWIA